MNEAETLNGMLAIGEQLAPIRELVVGYKSALEGDGIHSVSADRMAEHLHAELIRQVFRATQ